MELIKFETVEVKHESESKSEVTSNQSSSPSSDYSEYSTGSFIVDSPIELSEDEFASTYLDFI